MRARPEVGASEPAEGPAGGVVTGGEPSGRPEVAEHGPGAVDAHGDEAVVDGVELDQPPAGEDGANIADVDDASGILGLAGRTRGPTGPLALGDLALHPDLPFDQALGDGRVLALAQGAGDRPQLAEQADDPVVLGWGQRCPAEGVRPGQLDGTEDAARTAAGQRPVPADVEHPLGVDGHRPPHLGRGEAALVAVELVDPPPHPPVGDRTVAAGVGEAGFGVAHAEPEVGRQPPAAEVAELGRGVDQETQLEGQSGRQQPGLHRAEQQSPAFEPPGQRADPAQRRRPSARRTAAARARPDRPTRPGRGRGTGTRPRSPTARAPSRSPHRSAATAATSCASGTSNSLPSARRAALASVARCRASVGQPRREQGVAAVEVEHADAEAEHRELLPGLVEAGERADDVAGPAVEEGEVVEGDRGRHRHPERHVEGAGPARGPRGRSRTRPRRCAADPGSSGRGPRTSWPARAVRARMAASSSRAAPGSSPRRMTMLARWNCATARSVPLSTASAPVEITRARRRRRRPPSSRRPG